ncbi:SGNH/GDSL hydrolase family protein [Brevundimonas sp. M20]|uniref:SGNH/GDSL hydrolase family protein n=1 Tax=Brevundimonas sp. M20 TaxID=2591463 RepID=UPI0011470EB8|nr:SGNH/GDSL hydrolase family protein [Brevundimonas sp. M20]QDH72921.1 SGNH/GDSL hydrolase family protein [Brevundimonas sp. M20]
MKFTVHMLAAVALTAGSALPVSARAQTPAPRPAVTTGQPIAVCPLETGFVSDNGGLTRSRAAVRAGALRILAVGSSSIEGIGASRRELGFAPLLELGLERRLPGVDVTVFNRGIGGETAKETADRLERELAAGRVDLVIWQLGTNDVLRDRMVDDVFADFHRGEAVLQAADVDVLLIDPQRLPETTTNASFRGRNPALGDMARRISEEGRRGQYAVLHRFDAMAGWSGLERGGVGPDDLHLNDAGYACWAEVTAEGLAPRLR